MEPPTKRLRILQSVDVDETNPDYINAKQKQQQKFKGRLESIFAKYENMHESMSDEIDMKENKVVVDRGHLRRVVRQVRRKETVLLDNLGLAAGQEGEESVESSDEDEESADELAPTQPTKPSAKKDGEQSNPTSNDLQSSPVSIHTITAIPQPILQAPNTPDPTAQLLQLVQFPTTPTGQQAQLSFYATLAQTINQAVQQAVAPLVSSIIQRAPNLLLSSTPSTLISTPVTKADIIAPATDPKWFFPPLAAKPDQPAALQSSPLPANKLSNEKEIAPAELSSDRNEGEVDGEVEAFEDQSLTLNTSVAIGTLEKQIRRTNPRARQKREQRAKYIFTEEDDAFIIKSKLADKCTWAEIRNSKKEWHTWPMNIFWAHWSSKLKGKPLPPDVSQGSEILPHQLPTPSYSGHEEDIVEPEAGSPELANLDISSSALFDDDDRDLLSLPGNESDIEPPPNGEGNGDYEPFFPDADEVILPSIEITDFVDEDTLQQGLLEGTPTEDEADMNGIETTVHIKTEEVPASPMTIHKRARLHYQAIPDTESADEMDAHIPEPTWTQQIFTCDICKAKLKTQKNLDRHKEKMHQPTREPAPKSPSLDLIDNEDDLPSNAPIIKREPNTPSPPRSFLFSTPVQHPCSDNLSSSVKSASGLSRKAYLKQVKQSWTKKSVPSLLGKRKSMNALPPRKKAWAREAEGASEDELA